MRQLASPHGEVEPKVLAEEIGNFLRVVRQGWFYLAVGAALGLTLAGVYLARAQVAYRASTRLLVLQHQARPVGASADMMPVDDMGDSLATHLLIIRSPLVVQRS
jgi:uncharacterized protein involved in exopolysaccharide biosynthesis